MCHKGCQRVCHKREGQTSNERVNKRVCQRVGPCTLSMPMPMVKRGWLRGMVKGWVGGCVIRGWLIGS